MLKNGQWAKDWDCCQGCGTIDKPHKCKGICEKCYDKQRSEEKDTYNQQWREKHPNYDRQYRQEHRIEIAIGQQLHYQKHRTKKLAYQRQYDREHLNKKKERKRRRHAIKKRVSVSEVNTQKIYDTYNNTCIYCGAVENLTIDHVVPLAGGGAHCEDNLVVACLHCNCSKRDQLLENWLQTQLRSIAWVM
jgi:hypothetical protein